METMILDGKLFALMIRNGAANLNRSRTIVNELNVFPIPDGDTGDNMYMTIDSGSSVVADANETPLDITAAKIAKGMLLGARGNSGVILSRIFAGIAKGFLGNGSADVEALGRAFECGVTEAYNAVSVPVEGTILTVYRDAVNYANGRINGESTLESYFRDFLSEMKCSLERTPELLAVLKEAGVVDSGGAGFVYIAEGMQSALEGAEIAEGEGNRTGAAKADLSSFDENSELEYGYCTEFLLQLQSSKVDVASFDEHVITDYLAEAGESVVAFREGSVIKVHVHTFKPGEIMNFCQQYGEFLTVKIENMTIQHHGTTVRNGYKAPKAKVHKAYGVVTVATGSGMRELFASVGADAVIDGGQCMNPSTQDFIKAFDEVNADTILVLPNNSNIILTAKQAADLYEKADVRVINNRTVGEGYAALSMLDTSAGSTDEIIEAIEASVEGVVTGTVSVAVRDTEKDGTTVRKGDYIGFADETIYSDSPSRKEACLALAEKLGAGDYGVMLLFCGKDAEMSEAEELSEKFAEAYPQTEIITLNGDQPIYDYIMILE